MSAPLIFIADDEGASRELMAEVLRASGFDVVGVAEGASVLPQIRERRPSIVILDVMLGGFDGRELCRQIRNDAELAQTPVVLTSAMDEEDVDWRACGATAFRRKAANILQLPEFLNRLLDDSGGD